MITYEKVFIILKEKGLNRSWLRNNGVHALTVSKLNKNENVNISTINQLCNLLDCTPADILTFTKDEV